MTKTIAVAVTCHNRRSLTLAFLDALWNEESPAAASLAVFLTDDGSTDGTFDAVQSRFPHVKLIRGNGTLYWSGGMRLAMAEAMKSDPDFYWWLNDDTLLETDALARMLSTYEVLLANGAPDPIVVGSTKDPETGMLTYGGAVRSSWWHPLRFRLVEPVAAPVRCHAMNGNCVLISRPVVHKIGNLDPVFTQGRGDYDYALRAWKAGCSVWVAPGFFGTCRRNPAQGTWRDASLPLADRLGRSLGPKGLPPREWAVFARRHAGVLWPLFSVSPYVKAVLGRPRL